MPRRVKVGEKTIIIKGCRNRIFSKRPLRISRQQTTVANALSIDCDNHVRRLTHQDKSHEKISLHQIDSVGSDERNQALSERRAFAVRAALMNMAIGSDRVAARGYGEAFPIAGNGSAASRQLNRRVEIILSDNNGIITPR